MKCEFCGKDFQRPPKSRRRTCSDQCAHKLIVRNRGDQPWTPEEEDLAERMIGQHPAQKIYAELCKIARRDGRPERSWNDVASCLQRRFGTNKPTLDRVNVYEAARTLGVNRNKIQRWVRDGSLKTYKCGNRRVVSCKSLSKFAQQHPRQLVGADPDGLRFFIGEELARWVESHRPMYNSGAVRSLLTGEIFETSKQAARRRGISRSTITRSATYHYTTQAGERWEWVDKK